MTAKKLLTIDKSSLPESWKGATLADVTEYIQRGKGPKYIERSDLPVINQKCIRWFGIQKEHLKYVDPEQWSAWGEQRYVRVGDVLWNSTGTGTIGRAALVRNLAPGEKYVVDSHVTIVRPRDIDPQYVHYWIMSPSVQGSIEAMQSGSTNQVELSKSAVEALPIPVAPPNQQKSIVAEIEKQFSRLEEAVANLKRVKANLKRYKAAVLKAAVEGKLTEDWRKQHPNVESASKLLERILVERRARWNGRGKYKEPAKPDMNNLPSLPEKWTWASVDQLTSHITSGSRDWTRYYGRGSGTFILAQNVRLMRLDLSERQAVDPPKNDAETARTRVSIGDILVTIVGAKTGEVCRIPKELVDHFVCQSVALLRPLMPASAKFMELYLASPENGQAQWRQYIYGQGRPHLSFEQLKMTAIALPSLAEQHEIVAEVERRLSVIEELESAIEANLTRADRLRQSILQRAFSGRLLSEKGHTGSSDSHLPLLAAESVSPCGVRS
ncbi:MAG: restriction endonuclease subunit S [Nitrospirota bacterium]